MLILGRCSEAFLISNIVFYAGAYGKAAHFLGVVSVLNANGQSNVSSCHSGPARGFREHFFRYIYTGGCPCVAAE
ncbi:unnamed protein product [Victoria cruziana]